MIEIHFTPFFDPDTRAFEYSFNLSKQTYTSECDHVGGNEGWHESFLANPHATSRTKWLVGEKLRKVFHDRQQQQKTCLLWSAERLVLASGLGPISALHAVKCGLQQIFDWFFLRIGSHAETSKQTTKQTGQPRSMLCLLKGNIV